MEHNHKSVLDHFSTTAFAAAIVAAVIVCLALMWVVRRIGWTGPAVIPVLAGTSVFLAFVGIGLVRTRGRGVPQADLRAAVIGGIGTALGGAIATLAMGW